MKISEQAKRIAQLIYTNPATLEEDESRIQTAINDHERDLVEAAQGLVNQAAKFGAVPIDAFPLVTELKTALERRKE